MKLDNSRVWRLVRSMEHCNASVSFASRQKNCGLLPSASQKLASSGWCLNPFVVILVS